MTSLTRTPNPNSSTLASPAQIERTIKALEANNIHAVLAENGADAIKILFNTLPAQAQVFTSSSVTLDDLGISEEIDRSGRFDSVRAKIGEMDPKNRERDMQRLSAAPDYLIGSVHAVTETGSVIIASNTGIQLAGCAAGAAHVIWVVGTQKIVPTLEAGLKRVQEYSLPLEGDHATEVYESHSGINKLLIINKEINPGRTTLILVKEKLGY